MVGICVIAVKPVKILIQYKNPSAEKKLAPNADSFNSNYIRKWCHNHTPILVEGVFFLPLPYSWGADFFFLFNGGAIALDGYGSGDCGTTF